MGMDKDPGHYFFNTNRHAEDYILMFFLLHVRLIVEGQQMMS